MQSQARLSYAEVHPVFCVATFTVKLREISWSKESGNLGIIGACLLTPKGMSVAMQSLEKRASTDGVY